MPTGLFHTVLEGDSYWARLKNSFKDRKGIVGPDGVPIGSVKLNMAGSRMWELTIDGQHLHIPRKWFNAGDYPFEVEVVREDERFAPVRSGSGPMDDFHLECQGIQYLWKEASKLKRVKELQLEGDILARVYSKGVMPNHTFVEVNEELPIVVVGLLFPMYSGFFNFRTA